MYIIVVGKPNGDVEYFGPFKTEVRAKEYAKAVERDIPTARWHVAEIIAPFRS